MACAATIVGRRPTKVIPNPIAVTPKQLSITPIILTPLLYFVLSSFRLTFLVFHQFFYDVCMPVITINLINFHF